jgi:hypothetical protein
MTVQTVGLVSDFTSVTGYFNAARVLNKLNNLFNEFLLFVI